MVGEETSNTKPEMHNNLRAIRPSITLTPINLSSIKSQSDNELLQFPTILRQQRTISDRHSQVPTKTLLLDERLTVTECKRGELWIADTFQHRHYIVVRSAPWSPSQMKVIIMAQDPATTNALLFRSPFPFRKRRIDVETLGCKMHLL